jgi:hypothetical protein
MINIQMDPVIDGSGVLTHGGQVSDPSGDVHNG